MTSQTFSQRVIQKALSEKPWVTKKGPNTYRVTPRTASHGKYECKVVWRGIEPEIVSCVDVRTGRICEGFYWTRGSCYHAGSLLIHLLKREGKLAA